MKNVIFYCLGGEKSGGPTNFLSSPFKIYSLQKISDIPLTY